MKGDEKVIDFLNEALKNELTAINQYWLHYRMLDNWGVARLAAFEREESIDEMKHADKLADRVLFLGDYVSRDLFADILESEEHHVDELEKQFEMIERMGIENYIQLQSKPAGDD